MCLHKSSNALLTSNSCAKFDYQCLDVDYDDLCDYIDIEESTEVNCTDANQKLLFLNI